MDDCECRNGSSSRRRTVHIDFGNTASELYTVEENENTVDSRPNYHGTSLTSYMNGTSGNMDRTIHEVARKHRLFLSRAILSWHYRFQME